MGLELIVDCILYWRAKKQDPDPMVPSEKSVTPSPSSISLICSLSKRLCLGTSLGNGAQRGYVCDSQ